MSAGARGPIDRVAPTRRPAGRPVMLQSWRSLTFLHWDVPADYVQRGLPAGLKVDTFEGRAYLGLIPFTMTGVRPAWSPPVRGLSAFHETNVRTYVHRRGGDPGVWFYSLDAANAVAVAIARAAFHLPYFRARMSLHADPDGSIAYASRRLGPGPLPADCAIRARPAGPPAPAEVGTLEHFLAERYLLYAARGRNLYRGQVHHTPYPLQKAEAISLQENLVAAAGFHRPEAEPLAHFAAGVDVEVFPLVKIP